MRLTPLNVGTFLVAFWVGATGWAGPVNGRDHVVIRLYNAFRLPEADVSRAHSVAAAILERAGIAMGWRSCLVEARPSVSASDRCEDVLEGDEVVVRIVASPAVTAPPIAGETLGYSYVDTETGHGVLATVFADRVLAMAARAGGDRSRLLGQAVAHEVGHLLLGASAHSATGLMRARWLDSEVRGNAPRDWSFSKSESAAMRASLSARRRMDTEPATVTVRRPGPADPASVAGPSTAAKALADSP